MAPEPGEGPKGSSWNTWVRGSTRRRTTDDPPAADDPDVADAPDVTLDWAAADTRDEALGDDALDGDDIGDDRVAGLPGARDDDALDALDGDELDDGDDLDDLVPAVPLLPTIAGRVDALGAMLRTIAMRVDSLAATTNAFRSAVTDRIDEYADVVTGLARQADQTLDDYRRANERTVAELRRGIADHDELLHRAAGRLDELGTDVATLVELARRDGDGARPTGGTTPRTVEEATGDSGWWSDLGDLGDELAALRHDVGYLRGMIDVVVDTMPASADGSGGAQLTDAQLDQIAERVAERLSAAAPPKKAAPKKAAAKKATPAKP